MRLLLFVSVSLWMAALPAQDTYFARLAGEVCSCMERFTVEPVDRQAINCLREVALANEETLYKRYSLVAAEAAQRDLLAERLAVDLVRDCPLLATLNYDKEKELRWSDRDRPPDPEPLRYRSDKGPSADPVGSVTGESPREWIAEGTVQRLASGHLVMQLISGNRLSIELPTGFARSNRIKTGDKLKLSFRREWRKVEGRIVNVVVGLEE